MAGAQATSPNAMMARVMASHPQRPASAANVARNRRGDRRRARRWRPARDALWRLLSSHVAPGALTAVVGAGNLDDLPLTRLLDRAGRVDLVDLDPEAARRALRREPRPLRRRARLVAHDVTGGAADRIVHAAVTGRVPRAPLAPARPLPGHPYDVVLGDLLYTQLLYPGLRDAGVAADRVRAVLEQFGQPLTDSVVERLHASAPGGLVVHVHDVLGWWDDHLQPFTLADALARVARDPAGLAALAAEGRAPLGCEPFPAAARSGGHPVAQASWHWPFAPGTDYLVRAGVFRG